MEDLRDFSHYTDGAIVDMYWRRDEDAIAVTDGKYGRYLYKLAYNLLSDEDDSRSAVNDTYLGAWDSIPPSRPERLLLYLSKIARRVAVSLFRKSRAKKRMRSELVSSLDELSECLASDANTDGGITGLSALINDFLGGLSERERRMFVLRYYYADSVEDIAVAFSVGPSYVYRELAKMRDALADHLREEGYSI